APAGAGGAPPPLLVQEVEDGLGRARGLFGAPRFERGAGAAQAVLHGLVRHVALREVVEELGQDALDPARVPLLHDLGVAAVGRAALAARGARGEDGAGEAARGVQGGAPGPALPPPPPLPAHERAAALPPPA